jgi:glutamine amidotransferase
MNVQVIDLGIGNIQSLTSALGYLGVRHLVTSDPSTLDDASHAILPGVGSFDPAMESMGRLGFVERLRRFALEEAKPLIGVCLGMQLLGETSEEGRLPGLRLIAGRAVRLLPDSATHRKVPHVGFSSIDGYEVDGLFADIAAPSEFYFTHSYGMQTVDEQRGNLAWCRHTRPFVAGFQVGNICGVQFHPEKSQSTGLRLLSNFFERI